MELTSAEKAQLATILGCEPAQVDAELVSYSAAATEEYARMILGQRVFTRGQDILEYRLFLMIRHVFKDRLPAEREISARFQTTSAQSRTLLRAVMSKYQYELQHAIQHTLHEKLRAAQKDPNSDHHLLTIESENIIDALNRELAAINGALPQISKARGTVSTYDISPSSYSELLKHFP